MSDEMTVHYQSNRVVARLSDHPWPRDSYEVSECVESILEVTQDHLKLPRWRLHFTRPARGDAFRSYDYEVRQGEYTFGFIRVVGETSYYKEPTDER